MVDDQESARNAASELLKSMGYEVEFAHNISDAVEICASRREEGRPRFDLVLIDLLLGETSDGVDLGLRLREIEPDLPIVLMSGFTSPALVARAREAGVVEVLAKPILSRDIARCLASALQRHAL